MIQWLVGVDRDFCQVIRLQVERQPDRHSSGAALEKNLLEVHVNRLLSPLAVGAAAWLLVACGGGDSSGAAPGDGSQAGAQQAASSYRTAAPEGVVASRIDARLRGAQGQVRVWVSLEQNSVAAQRAALAEADVSLASDRMAIKSASALRAGVSAHKLRISETQGALSGQLSALGVAPEALAQQVVGQPTRALGDVAPRQPPVAVRDAKRVWPRRGDRFVHLGNRELG